MSKCTKCGCNFVGTPENPPVEQICKYCLIEQLTAERDNLKSLCEKLELEMSWVGVTEGLPRKDGRYLIYSSSGYVEECSFRNGKWVQWMPDDFGSLGWVNLQYAVTHWKLLPNPPSL
jgi:hypothetical protein